MKGPFHSHSIWGHDDLKSCRGFKTADLDTMYSQVLLFVISAIAKYTSEVVFCHYAL